MIFSPTASEKSSQAVTITAPTRAGLMNELGRRFEENRGFSIATLNLDHLVKLRRDPKFLDAYLAQSHVTADGNPIVWLSRLAGDRIDLVPGSELIEPVAQLAAEMGVKVAMVGSSNESLNAAARELEGRFPGLEVAYIHAPEMGFDPSGANADKIIDSLRESGARLCFLALGAPKQEIFAARAFARQPEIGFLSIGAGLDFISGAQTRAPKIFRSLALEWLWRLGSNPARLGGRYAACAALLPGLTVTAMRQRQRRGMQRT